MTNAQLDRFLAKVQQLPNGCWQWSAGCASNGYGKFKLNRRTVGAHRVSYEYFIGALHEGLEIDHLCRNRACVNPTHLDEVTHKTNVGRGLLPIVMPLLNKGNTYFSDHRHKESTKALIAAANRGRVKSPETCARISAARKGKGMGRLLSDDTKAKIAAARRAYWQRKREAS